MGFANFAAPGLDRVVVVDTERITLAAFLVALVARRIVWHRNQAYVGNGIGIHHHGRLSPVDRHLPDLLPWVRAVHAAAPETIDRDDASSKARAQALPAHITP